MVLRLRYLRNDGFAAPSFLKGLQIFSINMNICPMRYDFGETLQTFSFSTDSRELELAISFWVKK